MTSYSFSYSTTGTTGNAAQPPVEPELFSFNRVNVLRGPQGTVVLQHQRTDARMVVNADVAAALSHCKPFRTLEQHTQEICAQISALQGEEAAVMQTLEQVRDNGLLESAKTARARLLTSTDSPSATGPLTLAIITCDRPEALSRLLDSICRWTTNTQVSGIWVVDDSREARNIAANAAACEAAAAQAGHPVHHFDETARDGMLTRLIAALPESATAIRFALDRNQWPGLKTYGLARNWAQLLTLGSRTLIFDDDVLCEAVEPPLAASRFKFDNLKAREATFYDSLETLNRHKLAKSESPIELISAVLGNEVSGVYSTSSAASLAGHDGELLARFSGQSRIRQVQTGTWGDPGTSDATSWLFFLPPPAIDRLMALGNQLPKVLEARTSWVGFRGPTLTAYGAMSQLTGLDNRDLLPPYLPVLRGEDLLFSIMMNRIYPESPVFNTPWAVPHHPVEDRRLPASFEPVSGKLGISNLADLLGQEPMDQWGLSAQTRLQGLANEIRRLTEMANGPRAELVRHQTLSKQISLLNTAIGHISHAGKMSGQEPPAPWTDFLEKTRAGLIATLQTPDKDPIATLAESSRIDTEHLYKLGAQFAQCLEEWPAIREAAAELLPG